MEDIDKVSWDEKYTRLLFPFLPKGLIRRCVYSIQFNDDAHNLDHVYNVCSLAVELCEEQGIAYLDRQIILAGALMHDLGCRYDRDTHHFISYGMALAWLEIEDDGIFSHEDRYLVARACLEHRASYKGAFTGFHSEYVSLADRGVPCIQQYVSRAVLFRKDSGLSLEVFKEEVYKHLLDKFVPVKGYVWKTYPALGKELFHNQWEAFTRVLLNPEECLKLIEEEHNRLLT